MAYIECMRQYMSVIYLLNLIAYSLGEPFHTGRNLDDPDMWQYEKKTEKFKVTKVEEGLEMLVKYGYLSCDPNPKRGKRDTNKPESNMFAFLHERLTEAYKTKRCDAETIKEAIKKYQIDHDLKPTGVLGTTDFMQMTLPRCGNVDNGTNELVDDPSDQKPENTSQTDNGNGHTIKKRADHTQIDENKRHKRDIRHDDTSAYRHNNVIHKHVNTRATHRHANTRATHRHSHTVVDLSKTRPWHKPYIPPHWGNIIIKALTPRPPITAMDRRRKYLREYRERLKREPLDLNKVKELSRSKRSEPHFNFVNRTQASQMWQTKVLRWRVMDSGYSRHIRHADLVNMLELAFRFWAEIIPIVFVYDVTGNHADVDINIAFGRKDHVNCRHDFDGNGGEIAHSFPRSMHFDDDEHFRLYAASNRHGIYLLRVAVHEMGHVLGLEHSNHTGSIMHPVYHLGAENFEIIEFDRENVALIHGACGGTFDTVMDYVRVNQGKYVYNTFFYRHKHYWMYDNYNNRARYGDPLMVETEWEGLQRDIDAFVYVYWHDRVTGVTTSLPYFFKGEHVYLYSNDDSDDNADKVIWVKTIDNVFNTHNTTDPIPSNLNTVFFDYRDNNIYFFKEDMVYVYDPKVTINNTVRVVKLTDEFPPENGLAENTLPSNLDAAYFSYKTYEMFFFKDNNFWKNIAFDLQNKKRRENKVKFMGEWSNAWKYICDTTIDPTYLADAP